jgi:hypothetical protein
MKILKIKKSNFNKLDLLSKIKVKVKKVQILFNKLYKMGLKKHTLLKNLYKMGLKKHTLLKNLYPLMKTT